MLFLLDTTTTARVFERPDSEDASPLSRNGDPDSKDVANLEHGRVTKRREGGY